MVFFISVSAMVKRKESNMDGVKLKKKKDDDEEIESNLSEGGDDDSNSEEETSDRKERRVKYPKGQPRTFEAMCGVINEIMNRNVAASKTVLHKSKLKTLKNRVEQKQKNIEKVRLQNLGHVIPTSENSDKVLEKELALIATSSVVQLFAQIKKHQREREEDPKKAAYRERKEQIRQKRKQTGEDKHGILFRSSTSKNSDKAQKESTSKRWSVLDDKYIPL